MREKTTIGVRRPFLPLHQGIFSIVALSWWLVAAHKTKRAAHAHSRGSFADISSIPNLHQRCPIGQGRRGTVIRTQRFDHTFDVRIGTGEAFSPRQNARPGNDRTTRDAKHEKEVSVEASGELSKDWWSKWWRAAASGEAGFDTQTCRRRREADHGGLKGLMLARNSRGLTALHLAARRGQYALALELLKYGATVDDMTTPGGKTALDLAADYDRENTRGIGWRSKPKMLHILKAVSVS